MDVHEVLAVVVSSRHDKPREVVNSSMFANQPPSPLSIDVTHVEAPSPQAGSLISRMGSMFSHSAQAQSLSRNSTMGRQSSLNSQYLADFASYCDNASGSQFGPSSPMSMPKLSRNSTGINRGLADMELMFHLDTAMPDKAVQAR